MLFGRRNRIFCACRHLGGGALLRNLSDNSAHSGTLSQQNSQNDPNAPLNAQKGENFDATKAELDANILAGGGLGLDPENDPIVYTTDWGLDIKFHNDWGSFGTSTNSGGVAGYCYFTMGSYGGTAVNWVIIGRATNVAQRLYFNGSYSSLGTKYGSYTASDYPNHTAALPNSAYYKNNVYETSTDAGSTIVNAASKGLVYDFANVLFTNSVANAEITSGSVLCLSEKLIYSTKFHTSTARTISYDGSNLQTQINNLYSSTLGLTSTQQNRIKEQDLETTYYSYNSTKLGTIKSQKMFTLATQTTGYSQNFVVDSYLTTDAKRIAYKLNSTTAHGYYTRSMFNMSNYAGGIWSDGKPSNLPTDYEYGIRPAFVLKL